MSKKSNSLKIFKLIMIFFLILALLVVLYLGWLSYYDSNESRLILSLGGLAGFFLLSGLAYFIRTVPNNLSRGVSVFYLTALSAPILFSFFCNFGFSVCGLSSFFVSLFLAIVIAVIVVAAVHNR